MSHQKKILYADDDPDDKSWVLEACKAIDLVLTIDFVENGREVLHYLNQLSGNEMPALIVLDLNMPELDGRQTLQRIKADDLYKNIPVLIVTTSSNKVDMEMCKRLGAALYLVKPDTHKEWQYIVEHFKPYIS